MIKIKNPFAIASPTTLDSRINGAEQQLHIAARHVSYLTDSAEEHILVEKGGQVLDAVGRIIV